MANRKSIFDSLRLKMEEVGFQFETEQKPHLQNRKENELKFVHPQLIKQWGEEGYNARATKFYIKPLSDEVDCEIGLVTGKSSPLYVTKIYSRPNSNDTFGNIPAWSNKDGDQALEGLLKSIKKYLGI